MSLFKRLWSSQSVTAETKSTPQPGPAVDATWPAQDRRQRQRLNAKRGLPALIIDDSPTIVAALGKTLRSGGFLTIEANDAESGLELAKQAAPALIFLDIVLPGMNGFAALRLIRRDPKLRAVPVIMISGNEHATEQFYANRIGADDFMKKPFSRFEVFSRIESLLNEQLIPCRRPPGSAQAAAIIPEPPAMGLRYFDQAEYEAAVARNDQLAASLFVRAGSIKPGAGHGSQVDLAAVPVAGRQPN